MQVSYICEYLAFQLTYNCVRRVSVKMTAQVLILIFRHHILFFVWFVVFNANFNNISVISWWSVLLVVEPVYLQKTTCHKTLTNFITCCIEYTSPWAVFEITNVVVIGSYISNYHAITTAPAGIEWDEENEYHGGLTDY